jgi:hypothetical protein
MGGQIKGRAFVYEVALRGLLQFVVRRSPADPTVLQGGTLDVSLRTG